MKRCRCCRQTWPIECFGMVRGRDGTEYRRGRCRACQYHCGPARRRRAVARTTAYRAKIRADVEAVRRARTALKTSVGWWTDFGDNSLTKARMALDTQGVEPARYRGPQ